MEPLVEIILDGQLFAQRNWTIIPRVGEVLILKKGEIWAKVEQVVWSDDTAYRSPTERQWIQLVCSKTEPLAEKTA